MLVLYLFRKPPPSSYLNLPSLCFVRVVFRGILVSLSTLYQQLLQLLGEVAEAHPMPFLRDFSLPADMAQFLGPADACLLIIKTPHGHCAKTLQERQRSEKPLANVNNRRKTRKEDLGVAIERGVELFPPLFHVVRDLCRQGSERTQL